MAWNSQNHLLRNSLTETVYIPFCPGGEATVTSLGDNNSPPQKNLKTQNLYMATLQLHLQCLTKEAARGTGLSLRNLVLWWDSPRLIARTSAGRRPATVALCSSSIKPQGKFARNRWPGPQQSVHRLSHTFCTYRLDNPDPSISPVCLTDSTEQYVLAVSHVSHVATVCHPQVGS